MDNLSDVDLNMKYSDDEENKYWGDDPREVINHLFALEETNLFKIKHIEDAEQTLEIINLQSQYNIEQQKKKIEIVEKNIREYKNNLEKLK